MRKRSENQSTTSDGTKQAVITSLQNAPQTLVFELDTEARLVHLNHAIQIFSGYGLEEVQGQDWCKTFVPGRDRKRIRKFIRQALKFYLVFVLAHRLGWFYWWYKDKIGWGL